MSTHRPLADAKEVRACTCSNAALLSTAANGVLLAVPGDVACRADHDSTRTAHGVACKQATA